MSGILDRLYDFELLKHKLFIQAMGIERNRNRLKNIPYTAVEDIAITYRVLVSSSHEGIASFLMTNDLMAMYGVSKSQLHEASMLNAPKVMEARFSTMADILSESIGGSGLTESEDIAQIEEQLLTVPEDDTLPEMYILSNTRCIFGAAAMFYPGLMKQVAQQIGGEFYILPSSIHETILVKLPEKKGTDIHGLYSMVQEVNDSGCIVKEEDILSYSVYQYNAAEDRIELACNNMMEREAV